ncbi:hypothetical protein LXL04_032377 [Taraxacum kok-saghyz]
MADPPSTHPPTHFFKFVRPGYLFKLSIPRSFMTIMNGKRCSKAILRRGRREWSVNIDDKGFGDGWKRFVAENGVQERDFIFFKHQGSMVFDVSVYDQFTSCEKDYPNLFDEMEEEEHLTESDTTRTQEPKKLKKRKRNEEKIQVSDDSGFFISIMTPYVMNKSRLHVPKKFAKSNGLITERIYTQVYLEDDTQRSWPATLQKSKLELYLTGWHKFRIKNHLEVGDMCRFKLVQNGEVPVFKCSKIEKNFVKNHTQVKETSSSLNNHPFFISYLKPISFKRSVLYVPADFSRTNGLKVGDMILRNNKGRSWEVRLNKLRNVLYIGGGLRAFLKANGMKEGDEFKFELVDKEKDKPPIVNFFLIKSKSIKSHKEAKSTRKKVSILCEEDGRPYFVGELKSSSIKQSKLYLPLKFAKSNGLITNKKMVLKNVEDRSRSWTVELKNHKNKFYYIGRGWKDFSVAYGLKEGDHFKFELVNKGEKLIVNFHFQKSIEATGLPHQNKIEKVLEKARLEPISLPDTLQTNELKVPQRALGTRHGHIRVCPLIINHQHWFLQKICGQNQFFRSHSPNYQLTPPIPINCDPNQFLEEEDDESDD